MQFNSYLFLFVFLPLTLAGYFGLYRLGRDRGARLFLAGASFVFFGYGNPWYVALLLVSALFNWRVSRLLLGKAHSILVFLCLSPRFGGMATAAHQRQNQQQCQKRSSHRLHRSSAISPA